MKTFICLHNENQSEEVIVMDTMSVEQIYEQHVKVLPQVDKLKLVELITQKMIQANGSAPGKPRKRNIMELHNLGKEIWHGIDAQEYVNELRKEWDHRP
ncbi:MAG: hypothetical protein ACE5I1_18090 [bacterium]